MDLNNILVISGKPDLYELISHTKTGAVVESLVDHRRQPVFRNDRISSLNEISIFTMEDDKPLREVLQDIFRKEDGKAIALDYKKASTDELFAYFKTVLPDYDPDRVHASDVKKICSWYSILLAANKIDLEQPATGEQPAEGDTEAQKAEE